MITLLQIILLLLTTASMVFYLGCALCTLGFKRDRPSTALNYNQPVSILISVCGLDSEAQANWSSFCQQDYPKYEVLFGVMDQNDEAIPILKDIVAQFRDRARLFYDLPVRGINHKISNMMYLYEASQYDTLVLADSDIEVTPNYLAAVTAPLSDPNIGMVTCGYFDYDPKSLGAAFAAFGRCFDFIPSVLVARFLDKGIKFAIGPTMVTHKSILEKYGGLQRVVNRIADDYQMGKMTAELGYRVELSDYILNNDCSDNKIREVFLRELRWARTVRLNRGAQYYGLILSYGTVYALLLLFLSGGNFLIISFSILALLTRLIQVLIAIYKFNCPKLLQWLPILPLRDLMSFIIWLKGTFGRQIYWRGRWLEIGNDG
ncbi:glycosyl transferase family 2 [Gloeothece citriformis PCC 7424]|uniref:Glycosyl transferase family 2 n=1 Tax=Gloeothece citriformis (strain PCC 7424) TaxID=65393 RepID=B7KGN1_GLOC7|nr:glycosyltransferase [Gloeothece citriformis]ACK71958.1 glycosyl transferase family 2 [Gloeothece citriformis PCC 7424]